MLTETGRPPASRGAGEYEPGMAEPFESTDISGTEVKIALSTRVPCVSENIVLALRHAMKELAYTWVL